MDDIKAITLSVAQERISILIKEIGYTVKSHKGGGDMTLLRDVSAVFHPGTLNALMGPSGAGKTTLLDVIAGRKTQGKLSGDILIGGYPANKERLKSIAAYVEQFDTLLPTLTVRETFLYQAELKSSPGESAATRQALVEELIVKLHLTSCADTKIGSALFRGISGGQAKRTNVGISLVTRPRVLFLDEPTSGLDSQTSMDLMASMRELADTQGVNILATIHSPTSETFRLFDSLLMLRSGCTTFAGPLFGDIGSVPYFTSLGFAYNPQENLADFLIATVGQNNVIDFAGEFARSEHCKRNLADVAAASQAVETRLATRPEAPEPRRTRGPIAAIVTLLKYRSRLNYQDPEYLIPRCATTIVFSLVMMSMYWGKGDQLQDQANQLNMASLFFMNNILPAFGALGYMPTIVLERPLFYREQDDGCYPLASYLVYKVIEEGFISIPVTLLGQIMLYFSVGVKGSFFWFWFVHWIVLQCGIALAYVCAGIAVNMDMANTLLPLYNTVQLLFSGILIRLSDIPDGWMWWTHTLFVRYGWQALMLNHFKQEEPKVFLVEDGSYQGMTEYYGADRPNTVEKNVGFLVLIWLIFLVITGIVMSNVRHQNR